MYYVKAMFLTLFSTSFWWASLLHSFIIILTMSSNVIFSPYFRKKKERAGSFIEPYVPACFISVKQVVENFGPDFFTKQGAHCLPQQLFAELNFRHEIVKFKKVVHDFLTHFKPIFDPT